MRLLHREGKSEGRKVTNGSGGSGSSTGAPTYSSSGNGGALTFVLDKAITVGSAFAVGAYFMKENIVSGMLNSPASSPVAVAQNSGFNIVLPALLITAAISIGTGALLRRKDND